MTIWILSLLFTQAASASIDLTLADADFRARIHDDRAREALTLYRKISDENSDSSDADWRRSMACYFNGLRLEKSRVIQESLYSEGQTWGRRAVARNPNCAECHFWTAINMALYGQSVGPLHMLFTLHEIEEHLEKSIALNPSYADAGAYRLLALIQQKLPGILGGSTDRARQYFEKAIQTSPAPLNYLFYAQFTREVLHDESHSRALITQGLARPRPGEDSLEQREAYDQLVTLSARY